VAGRAAALALAAATVRGRCWCTTGAGAQLDDVLFA
jgi:hypothetical protein